MSAVKAINAAEARLNARLDTMLSEVREFRGAVSEMFKHLLEQGIEIRELKKEEEGTQARVRLLEDRVTALEKNATAAE